MGSAEVLLSRKGLRFEVSPFWRHITDVSHHCYNGILTIEYVRLETSIAELVILNKVAAASDQSLKILLGVVNCN